MKAQIVIDARLREALIELGVFRMFMENCRQQNYIGFMAQTVSHGFVWSESPQGHEYWGGIYLKTVAINPKLSRAENYVR